MNRLDAIDERPFAVGVMMQMHLDVRRCPCRPIVPARRSRPGDIALPDRRRCSRAVAPHRRCGAARFAASTSPSLHALERRSIVRTPPPRLEMIGNRDPDSRDRGPVPVGDVVQSGRHVSGQPQRERAQGREMCRFHRLSATGVVTRATIGGACSTGAPACGTVPPWRGPAIRAVGVQTIDCAPRTKVSNPRRSARFIERK